MIRLLIVDDFEGRIEKSMSYLSERDDVAVTAFIRNKFMQYKNRWRIIHREIVGMKYDVVLRHGRSELPADISLNAGGLSVCYGGYKGIDPGTRNGEENLERAVHVDTSFEEDELDEIITYYSSGLNEANFPKCLVNSRNMAKRGIINELIKQINPPCPDPSAYIHMLPEELNTHKKAWEEFVEIEPWKYADDPFNENFAVSLRRLKEDLGIG